MKCPNCGANAEAYDGTAAHKLNTAFCATCGRVALPKRDTAEEKTDAKAESKAEPDKK